MPARAAEGADVYSHNDFVVDGFANAALDPSLCVHQRFLQGDSFPT